MKAMILGALLLFSVNHCRACPPFKSLGVIWGNISNTEELLQFTEGVSDQLAEITTTYELQGCWRDDHERVRWNVEWVNYVTLLSRVGAERLQARTLDHEKAPRKTAILIES